MVETVPVPNVWVSTKNSCHLPSPFQIVKMLADAKCDVSMQDCNGATAADLAEKAKEADILKFLKVNRSLTRHGFEFRSSKFRTF